MNTPPIHGLTVEMCDADDDDRSDLAFAPLVTGSGRVSIRPQVMLRIVTEDGKEQRYYHGTARVCIQPPGCDIIAIKIEANQLPENGYTLKEAEDRWCEFLLTVITAILEIADV